MSDGSQTTAALRWRCRRGMRELDLVLGGWLDAHYATADSGLKAGFLKLLERQDPEIMAFLYGQVDPPGGDLGAIVTELRGDTAR